MHNQYTRHYTTPTHTLHITKHICTNYSYRYRTNFSFYIVIVALSNSSIQSQSPSVRLFYCSLYVDINDRDLGQSNQNGSMTWIHTADKYTHEPNDLHMSLHFAETLSVWDSCNAMKNFSNVVLSFKRSAYSCTSILLFNLILRYGIKTFLKYARLTRLMSVVTWCFHPAG